MRIDKFLKNSRLIKRRTVAKAATDGEKITVNDRVAKPSTQVKEGDIIGITFKGVTTRYEVLATLEHVQKEGAADMIRRLEAE